MKNIFVLSFVLATAFACNNKIVENKTEKNAYENVIEITDAQFKNAELEMGKIEKKAISSLLKVNGKIEVPPQNMISISVPLGGYLKSTQLLEGMHVSKGEVIAVMEDPLYVDLQQEYLTTKTQLIALEKEFQRQKELNNDKSVSDKIFEKAQAEYTSYKVTLNALSQKLQLIHLNPDQLNENNISRSINIYSPIDGYVSTVNMNIGKYAAPTDILFELVNPADIHLTLTVFEKDLNQLFIGQKLEAFNNNHPEIKYSCEIILVGKALSSERSAIVHCHFEQYDKSLIPGMYMNAEVEISTHNAYVISNEGIVRFEGKQYVFLALENYKFEMQEVLAKNSEYGFTQIVFLNNAGAVEDKNFVTKGAYTLLMAMKNTAED